MYVDVCEIGMPARALGKYVDSTAEFTAGWVLAVWEADWIGEAQRRHVFSRSGSPW